MIYIVSNCIFFLLFCFILFQICIILYQNCIILIFFMFHFIYIIHKMKKINENRKEIIEKYNNDVSIRQIAKEYNISHCTLNRFIKNLSDVSEEKIEKSQKSQNNDSNESNNDKNETENINNDSNESSNADISEEKTEESKEESEKTEESKEESKKKNNSFDEMLKNDINVENKSIIIDNKINDVPKNSPLLKPKQKTFIKIPSVKSIKQPRMKQNNKSEMNYNFIHDIKETDPDLMKEKRSNIVIIRQYINSFPEQLKIIYQPNKERFVKSLISLENGKLLCILEQIRTELNLIHNKNMFNNVLASSLIGFEQLLYQFDIDVRGCYNDFVNSDPDVKFLLMQIACEYDISNILSPKSMLFIKLIKSYYLRFQENKIKNAVNNINIDENKMNDVKNKYADL